ncbi:hypothetical protein LAHI110946_03510 [Lactococcus hircilactis]
MKVLMINKINKKVLFLICILILMLLGMKNKVNAVTVSSNLTNVELQVTNNGVPAIHSSYSAMNIERAYQEIKDGKISEKAINSAAWILASQNTNSGSNKDTITLSDGQKIGQGVTHTDEEMSAIISDLINVDNLSLISEINQSNTTVPFLNPEHVIYKFTNDKGIARAAIEQGHTLILDNDRKFIKLVKIQNNSEKVFIDLANTDSEIYFKADSKLNDLATNFGQYVVGTNQKFSFNLSISKTMWKQAGSINLVLPPKSNLSFDSIKVLDNQDAVAIVTNPALSDTLVYNSSEPVIAASISLNATQENILLRVTVHVNLEGNNVSTNKPITTSMQAISVNKDGSSSTASTPNLVIAGANFAMTKEKTTHLAQGGTFLLAKAVGNYYEIYGKNQKWNKFEHLENLPISKCLVLEGGNRYILGAKSPQSIPLDVSRFNFNEKKSEEINKSVIQIIGLAQGNHYFLYRINTNQQFTTSDRSFKFSIFSRSFFSPNNSLMVDNSINHPTHPLIGISGEIPDYNAGVNEYNNISLDGSKQDQKNNSIYIFAAVSGVCVLALILSVVIAIQKWI